MKTIAYDCLKKRKQDIRMKKVGKPDDAPLSYSQSLYADKYKNCRLRG